MNYEVVTLDEKTVTGISARTNNTAPDMGMVIGGLWEKFFQGGVYASIPNKTNDKALGIYTEYAGNEKDDYTVFVGCETTAVENTSSNAVCRIPAGKYAKFIAKGDMREAVATCWQEIWQMNLKRSFVCDFEEYQNDSMENAEIHIYIGLLDD